MFRKLLRIMFSTALLVGACQPANVSISAAVAGTPVSIAVTSDNLNNATMLQNFKNIGVNFEMSKTSDEMWNSNGNWMEQSYANSGIKIIRWGYDAWVYDWEKELPLNTNYQGGMNTKDDAGSFGLREFVKFAKKYNIIPFLHLPIESWNHKNGKSDPTYGKVLQLATNMALYLKQNGIEKAYFDMGNEPMEAPSCPYGTLSAQVYGSTFKDFYNAIKAVDPNYKIVMMANNTTWYNSVKRAASENGKLYFDAIDYHNYPGSGVGWNGTTGSNGYYQRNDDNIFVNFGTVDPGVEKIMGECNIPWPYFPTYSTSLGSSLALLNGFLDLANDDQYSSIIMWPSQWPSNSTTTNAFNPSGKSFGWFDQDGWYDQKETNRLNGPTYAVMMAQKFILSKKVTSTSSDAKVRTFAYTNDTKSELNIFVINKKNTDMQFNLNIPSQYNRVKATVLSGDKDASGYANTDETPDYRGHLENEVVANGQFQDTVSYGECAVVYTFYTDNEVSEPGAFQTISPADQASNISTAVNFTWGASQNATNYRITLSKNADLSNPVIETTTSGNRNYQLSNDLEYSTTYYWKVTAINSAGQTVADGNIDSFTTARQRHFVDSNDSSITYTGDWSLNQAYLGSFGRTDCGSATAGASMTINFNGTQAILYGIKDNWIRKVSVSVDGGASQTYDLYESRGVMEYDVNDPAHYSRGSGETEAQKIARLNNQRPTQQVIFDTGKLSDTDQNHTVTVTLLNEWNQNVTASWKGFEFDYYEIIKAGETPLKTVAAPANITQNLPATKTVNAGETIQLSATAQSTDGGNLTYEWYKDGVLLKDFTQNTINIADANSNNTGEYYVRITNWNHGSTAKTVKSQSCNVFVEGEISYIHKYENITLTNQNGYDISADKADYQGLDNLQFTTLFKIDSTALAKRMALFTLSDGNGGYITSWYTPNSGNGCGQISVAYTNSATVLVWSRNASFVNDTKWHKLTVAFTGSSMNIALDGKNTGANGTLSVTDPVYLAYMNNFFLNQNNVTWKNSIAKVLIGGYDANATYAVVNNRAINPFQGEMKYVTISGQAASADEALVINKQPSAEAFSTLTNLINLDMGQASAYTTTSWNTYLSAKTAAQALTATSYEQDVWNAYDTLLNAMNALQVQMTYDMLHWTLDEFQMPVSQQILVDRKLDGNRYLAHPDMIKVVQDVMSGSAISVEAGTLSTSYSVGHGKGQLRLKSSDTRGLTWSDTLPTPTSWSSSEETPTMYELQFQDGSVKYIEVSGAPTSSGWSVLGGWQSSISDDGIHWSEFTRWYGNDTYYKTVDSLVAMASLVHLKDSSGNYIDKWMGVYHDASYQNYRTYLTFDANGNEQWSEPQLLLKQWRGTEYAYQMCELGIIRSPESYDGGKTLALLARNQTHSGLSTISFSSDEGITWTKPRVMPAALYGERHKMAYDPISGRLVITFREMSLDYNKDGVIETGDWRAGDWVAWVGTFSDLVNGTQGEYRMRLAEDYTATTYSGDCGYAGIEVYEDGMFVLDSYGKWDPNEDNSAYKGAYIIAVRFMLSDIDDAMYHNINRVALRNQTELATLHKSNMNPSDYDTTAWNAFVSAIDNANRILAKDWSTSSQTEIDAAVAELKATGLSNNLND